MYLAGDVGGTKTNLMVFSPEGGPLAALQDGDMIEIDIPGRRLQVRLDEATLSERLRAWQPPSKPIPPGFMRLYAERVGPASQGAILI